MNDSQALAGNQFDSSENPTISRGMVSRDFVPHIGQANHNDIQESPAFFEKIILSGVGVTEGRILGIRLYQKDGYFDTAEPGTFSTTASGWFDGTRYFINNICCMRTNVYLTINPVKRELLSRSPNKYTIFQHAKKGQPKGGSYRLTTDDDIVLLRWIYFDIDPRRPSGVSATDPECDAGVLVRDRILTDNPRIRDNAMWGSSGNGTFILLRIPDVANNHKNNRIVKSILLDLKSKYDTADAQIDPSTCNPSRIMCAIGTLKRKGENTPQRPWRYSRLDGVGANL